MSGNSYDHAGVAPTRDISWRASILSTVDAAAKRTCDVILATTLLVILLPLIIVCAIVIAIESPGPIFYRAVRVGRHGRELQVLKFRKMRDGAQGAALTGETDARFTRLGALLARTKLDEIPQLWNVLRGDMSLVGPRPEDPEFVSLHSDAYQQILRVRPGITGLCQLAFARESEILDGEDRLGHYLGRILPQKVGLDVLYANSRTLRGDLRILVWTILPVALRVEVAVNRRTGELTVRRRH